MSVPRVSVHREKKSLCFLNISPTLVINASMERSSRVFTTAWKSKNLIFFKKSMKLNFDLYFDVCQRAEITLASSISGLH